LVILVWDYGFGSKSLNDEITLYSYQDQINFLGYFELTTVKGQLIIVRTRL